MVFFGARFLRLRISLVNWDVMLLFKGPIFFKWSHLYDANGIFSQAFRRVIHGVITNRCMPLEECLLSAIYCVGYDSWICEYIA